MPASSERALSGVATVPSKRMRSRTPSRRTRGTSGTGGGIRKLYRSSLSPSRISMTSRWPSVVSRPTFAPFRSSRPLVATVVPWTMRSVLASSPRRSVPHSAASRPRPSMRPSDWSRGVDAHLAMTTRPFSSTAARSVNVPPTSIPIRHMLSRRGPSGTDRAGNAGARAARGRFSPSVEARAVAGLQPALVVLDAHAGDLDLVVEDLRRRAEACEIWPARRLPEPRALERLRAVQEDLLDLDADGEARHLAVHGQRGEQVGVACDARAPVDAQGLAARGDEEEQADVGIGEDVAHAVQALVARPVGDHEVRVVEHAHETRGVALGRHVAAPVGARRGQQHEWRVRD